MTDQNRIPEIHDRSMATAIRPRIAPLAEQIAREILEDVKASKVIGAFAACLFGFEPEDPSILTPSEISEIRAEVKRRVALLWARAA